MDLALAGRLIAACVVIGGVLACVGVISRWLVRGRATSTPGGRLIAVLETATLPGAASLHVVRIADRYYAVGRSGAHIATLAEIASESVRSASRPTPPGSNSFGRLATLVVRARDPRV